MSSYARNRCRARNTCRCRRHKLHKRAGEVSMPCTAIMSPDGMLHIEFTIELGPYAPPVINAQPIYWGQPHADPLIGFCELMAQIRNERAAPQLEDLRQQIHQYHQAVLNGNYLDVAGAQTNIPRQDGEEDGAYAVRLRAVIERDTYHAGEDLETIEPLSEEYQAVGDGEGAEAMERDALENADWLREILTDTEERGE